MSLGEQLKIARKKKGLTQKQLAIMLELSEITIRQYEANKRQPRLAQLQKIADVLEINLVELIGVDGIIDQSKLILNDFKTHPQNWNMTDVHTFVEKYGTPKEAAHFDGDEYTKEELEDIKRYAEFVKSKRDSDFKAIGEQIKKINGNNTAEK